MNTFRFNNGDVYETKLNARELVRRLNRLDTLRVLTEQHETGEGVAIWNKALKAYNKFYGFTGIIRLTPAEKEWLSYKLESNMLDNKDIETIEYYCK